MAVALENTPDQSPCQEAYGGELRPPMTLDRLVPGQIATILRVHGPAAMRRRLLEMGLVRGETIAVERYAPLGDPVQYWVKGYFLSLRRRDAAQIEVNLQA